MPLADSRSTLPVILFDLDGTLIDSLELLIEAMQHAFASREGPAPTVEEWVSSIGRPLRWQFGQYAGEEEVQSLVQSYRTYQLEHHDRLTRLYEGIHDVVVRLHEAGHRLGVVTSKGDQLANHSLAHVGLSPYLDIVVGMDATERHKPEPEPILFAIERLGVAAGDAVYVGDSTYDVMAANAAGVTSIGVTWGAASHQALRDVNASHLVGSPAELEALIAQLRGALSP